MSKRTRRSMNLPTGPARGAPGTARLARAVATLALALALAGCGDDGGGGGMGPPTTGQGFLEVVLDTPNDGDGAVFFRLNGEADQLSVPAGFTLFEEAIGNAARRVIVVGPLSDGVVLRFRVPDVSGVAGYRATLLQVAAAGTYERRSHEGYELEIVPGS